MSDYLQSLLKDIKNKPSVKREFMDAVQRMAIKHGHILDEHDIDQIVEAMDNIPVTQRDEEDFSPAITTMAIGEEDTPPRARPPGGITSQALGEEDKPQPKPDKPAPPITTQAVGEEGKPKRPPRRNATTLALGEENRGPRP